MAKKINKKNVKNTKAKKPVKKIKHAKFSAKSPTQRFGMPPQDLGKCIIQNIKALNPSDAKFELNQLTKMTGITFDKERKQLSNPNIAGSPKKLHQVIEEITKKYPKWQQSQLTSIYWD